MIPNLKFIWLSLRPQPMAHDAFAKLVHSRSSKPLIIRWGSNTISDVLRQPARCTRCGARGAMLMHPSWGGSHIGVAPSPAHQLAQ